MLWQDKHLEEVFQEPPMIAYKRNKNLKDALVRAKVSRSNNRIHRDLKGMKKCGKCVSCSYVIEGKSIKTNKFTWKINKQVNCNSSNVVYLLKCDKENCRMEYIGETERPFKQRINEHIGYAKNNHLSKTTGHHFNLPGHTWKNMTFTIIEKVKESDTIYRQEREKFFINKFGTYHKGMNKLP